MDLRHVCAFLASFEKPESVASLLVSHRRITYRQCNLERLVPEPRSPRGMDANPRASHCRQGTERLLLLGLVDDPGLVVEIIMIIQQYCTRPKCRPASTKRHARKRLTFADKQAHLTEEHWMNSNSLDECSVKRGKGREKGVGISAHHSRNRIPQDIYRQDNYRQYNYQQ